MLPQLHLQAAMLWCSSSGSRSRVRWQMLHLNCRSLHPLLPKPLLRLKLPTPRRQQQRQVLPAQHAHQQGSSHTQQQQQQQRQLLPPLGRTGPPPLVQVW